MSPTLVTHGIIQTAQPRVVIIRQPFAAYPHPGVPYGQIHELATTDWFHPERDT